MTGDINMLIELISWPQFDKQMAFDMWHYMIVINDS